METGHIKADLKKVVIGFLYRFFIELIFITLALVCMLVIWYAVKSALQVSDHQHAYVYSPYEIKWIVVSIGTYKKRVAVKRYLKRKKIFP